MRHSGIILSGRPEASPADAGIDADLRLRVQELERCLQAARASLAALFEHGPDPAVILRGDGRIVRVNARATEALGWRTEDLHGRALQTLMVDAAGVFDQALQRAMLPGGAARMAIPGAVRVRAAGEDEVSMEVCLLAFDGEGARQVIASLREMRPRQALLEVQGELERERDLRMQRVAELTAANAELARARQDADAANRAKSEFLAAMSHEIRTPMNGVIGMLDVLGMSSLRPHQVDLVNTGRESALGLLGIIDDILDFAKIEAGRLELEVASFSIARLVEETCAALDPIALRKGVELYLYTDPRLPQQVLGDALRIRQVLNNLLSNAIKFSSGLDHPGRVRLRAVCADEGADTVSLMLSVSDNGIGMTRPVLERLFRPFSQAESSTTRRYGGTGLGLSISRQLTELMGGSIAVASAPGEGAQFTVSLRLALDGTQRAPAACGTRLDGVQCWLVTDDCVARADWTLYLQHAGAEVRHFTQAQALAEEIARGLQAQTVAILDSGDDALDFTAPSIDPGAAADARLRYLLLGRGRRRTPRNDDARSVSVDRGALRYGMLVQAVALASGRQSEEEIEAAAGQTRLPSVAAAAEVPNRGRILIAEDNEINQKVIRYQLHLLGYAADVAANGREALGMWRRGGYALILTDLHMPDMDGYALARAIRAEEGTERIPIVAFTANALRGEEERCRAAGMDGYLTKPVQLRHLQETLRQWLPEPAASSARGNVA